MNYGRIYLLFCYIFSPSKQAMEQLAENLVTTYPALGDPRKKHLGASMWYQNISHGPGPRGFLEERLKNQRKKMEIAQRSMSIEEIDISPFSWESECEDGRIYISNSIIIFTIIKRNLLIKLAH